MTVTGTLVEAAPDAKLNDIKALLGRMMFSGKAMEKKVFTETSRNLKQSQHVQAMEVLVRTTGWMVQFGPKAGLADFP